ncbi:MAG: alanine--tRNA ligase [Planctomycetota bacterium]|nr:alanine--tRNA ligase [Planctomycetota bacterium]
MSKTSKQIRREFIQFFEDRGHTFVPSASLLPADDPTLLFTNAGMNQFKDVFLGTGSRPYTRAVNYQKIIRAGGKHNDLEDVGHDTYHHTFFEMLGNWSFGDYFKAEAIAWAWELLTDVWSLPKDKLWVGVFGGDEQAGLKPDDEATELWPKVTGIPHDRVLPGAFKDNFWEMGETGPCGPCTEIHIDLGEGCCDGSPHPGLPCGVSVEGCRRFIELWNLVFIQFNRDATGKLEPLPAKHVDTGLGLERISAVLQGATDNYATDIFSPLMNWLAEATGIRYGDAADTDIAMRVIADHARACTFAIADSILPSNEGRGYVIRRILRRAARFGRNLDQHEPFIYNLAGVIAEQVGDFFPEVAQRAKQAAETILEEEESFNRTLDRGLDLFGRAAEKVAAEGGKQITGDVAFELYATFGFPVDMTQQMAAERGLTVDMTGYEEEMGRHREISAEGGGAFHALAITGLPETDDSAKYDTQPVSATVLGWVVGEDFISDGALAEGAEAAVVLDKTNFYGESGGQVGDSGMLTGPDGTFAVRDTKLVGHCVLHVGQTKEGTLSVGQDVTAHVSAARADTMRNHTSTHLLNWALRKFLGGKIDQAGSVVAPDRLRFDFTYSKAVTAEQLVEVERMVNERILADEPIFVNYIPLAQARKIPGVRAVFGEKYPDPVRVVSVGADDPVNQADESTLVEFCGGTHLKRTSQAGFFKILSEESVAKGVRRITAVTGHQAVRHIQRLDEAVSSATSALRVPIEQISGRITAMQKEIKQLRRQQTERAGVEDFGPDFVVPTPEGDAMIGEVAFVDAAAMRKICDMQRQRGAAAVLIGGAVEGKVTLVAMVGAALVKSAAIKAGDWVKTVAAVVGGTGGGKATMAQAGGKDAEKLPEALKVGADWLREKLK